MGRVCRRMAWRTGLSTQHTRLHQHISKIKTHCHFNWLVMWHKHNRPAHPDFSWSWKQPPSPRLCNVKIAEGKIILQTFHLWPPLLLWLFNPIIWGIIAKILDVFLLSIWTSNKVVHIIVTKPLQPGWPTFSCPVRCWCHPDLSNFLSTVLL